MGELQTLRENLQLSFVEPLQVVIQQTRLDYVEKLKAAVLLDSGAGGWRGLSSTLGRLTTHPLWGVPILGAVLYGLYWFVGIFGAGTLVGLLEEDLFGQLLNPWITGWVGRVLPWQIVTEFLVGEYGLWTMGMTYALALIMPIVSWRSASWKIPVICPGWQP
jgi:ferrous iron transport protein B